MLLSLYRLSPVMFRLATDNITVFAKLATFYGSRDNERKFQPDHGYDSNSWSTSTLDLEQQLQEPNIQWAETWRLNGGEERVRDVY